MKRTPAEIAQKRAEDMAKMYARPMTLQQIGDSYGITRERVRQILAKNGVTRRHIGKSVRIIPTLSRNCSSCGEVVTRKYYLMTTFTNIFCNWGCKDRFWSEKSFRRTATQEEKRERVRNRMREYRKTPKGLASMNATRKKYLVSDKYKKWYEAYKLRLRAKTLAKGGKPRNRIK